MCNFETLEGRWETTWDTADDAPITLYPFNGTAAQELPMQFIHVPFESPEKPKKKSKWMEKKLKRYDR